MSDLQLMVDRLLDAHENVKIIMEELELMTSPRDLAKLERFLFALQYIERTQAPRRRAEKHIMEQAHELTKGD